MDSTRLGAAPQEGVKGAARTLDLFEAFSQAKGPLSLTELAQRIGSPVSSCHALVRTLQARGYLYVLDQKKRIYPTQRLVTLANSISRHDPVLERLTPVLERLMQRTGETVLLGKRQGAAIIYISVIEGTHTIRYAADPGDRKPLHSSAIGKAVLSSLEEYELNRLIDSLRLEKVTDRTITDPTRLRADLATGRARGHFETVGENVPEVMAISIVRPMGGEFYGVAIAGPIARIRDRSEVYVEALRSAGTEIEMIDAEIRGVPTDKAVGTP